MLRVTCCEVRGTSFGVFDFGFSPPASPERLATRLPCKARAGRWQAGIADFGLQKGDGPNLGCKLGAAGYEQRVADRRISGTSLAL